MSRWTCTVEDMQQITDRIRAEMAANGLSVSGLSRKTAIPRVTLIRRLADPTTMTLSEVSRIAEALGISPFDLASAGAA